ncbi:MAG: FAD-binding protein [Planctomycetes bacterium]|nr:FAD-binding protein [Planctomycetota bacterium]
MASLLRRFPQGRVLVDTASKLAYECDGFPLHRRLPLAIVVPRSTEDVRDIVKLCNEHGVAFVARGAGTGLSGGATPGDRPTVVLALAGMRELVRFDPDDRVAVVQPGLVNLDLSVAIQDSGLCFAPDPSSQKACTLGGNVAENSGGPHCFKYGMTTDHVVGVTLVTADGTVRHLREGDGADLLGLVPGHEGTFGILTELELRLVPAPQKIRTWLAAYSDMSAACRAVSRIVGSGVVPAALEILDELTIRAVEASVYAAGYPQDAGAVLLIELDGSHLAVDTDTAVIESILAEEPPLTLEATEDAEQRTRLWKGRKGAFGAMGRLAPDLYVLDGVVPRSKLERVLQEICEIGRTHEVTLSNVFHAGDGNLHPNLSFDGRDPIQRARALEAGREILALCVREGGSISGEHGVGSEKLEHMEFMFASHDIEIFRAVKACFDPKGLCNPHKAIPTGASCKEGASAKAPGVLGAH